MKIQTSLTDEAILAEMGARLSALRLSANLTQADLAEQAGVSKRTIERLESGQVATQFPGFLRVCRVLGLLERLDSVIPQAGPSPMALLKLQGRKRQRASTPRQNQAGSKKWTWGES